MAGRSSKRQVVEAVAFVGFWVFITMLIVVGVDTGISGTEIVLLWVMLGLLLAFVLFGRRRRAKRVRERRRLP